MADFQFIEDATTTAEQKLVAAAIANQQRAGFKSRLDVRIFKCPSCGAQGMNTGWGYVAFECGAEILNDGEGTQAEPCQAKQS